MEVQTSASRGRRQNELETHLSLYTSPPDQSVSLEEFENFAYVSLCYAFSRKKYDVALCEYIYNLSINIHTHTERTGSIDFKS